MTYKPFGGMWGELIQLEPTERRETMLAELEAAYDNGEGEISALLYAMELCLSNELVAPEWIAEGFRAAWFRFLTGKKRTLNDAFGIEERPRYWRENRISDPEFVGLLWVRTLNYLKVNPSPNTRQTAECVAEDIKEDLGIGAGWRDIEPIVIAVLKEHPELLK